MASADGFQPVDCVIISLVQCRQTTTELC